MSWGCACRKVKQDAGSQNSLQHYLQDLMQVPLSFEQGLRLLGTLGSVRQPLDLQSSRSSGEYKQWNHSWESFGWCLC